jgi:hypothetical protein
MIYSGYEIMHLLLYYYYVRQTYKLKKLFASIAGTKLHGFLRMICYQMDLSHHICTLPMIKITTEAMSGG